MLIIWLCTKKSRTYSKQNDNYDKTSKNENSILNVFASIMSNFYFHGSALSIPNGRLGITFNSVDSFTL